MQIGAEESKHLTVPKLAQKVNQRFPRIPTALLQLEARMVVGPDYEPRRVKNPLGFLGEYEEARKRAPPRRQLLRDLLQIVLKDALCLVVGGKL